MLPLNNAGLIRVNFVEIQNQESRNVKPLVEKYITVECLQKKKSGQIVKSYKLETKNATKLVKMMSRMPIQ